jgi:branched-chain amino acid transport system substrate-binding protein
MNQNDFEQCLKELTKRQENILKLFLQGKNDSEIAGFHEEVTVRRHVFNICKIFGLNNNEHKSRASHRDPLIDLFIRYKGAWVANCVREQGGFPKWEDPDSNRDVERTGSNFYLEQAKNCRDTTKAIKLYEEAVNGDRSDPYAQIYLNNAKARQHGNPLRIGVVIAKAGNDFHEFASIQVLRGVADTQTEFNEHGGYNGRLLEIDIRNDGNRPSDAQEIAQLFADDLSILAIVGHHSSESTKAALSIYERNSIVVISPTSTSSTLSGRTFFRTVGSTKAVANKYTQYIMDCLKLDKIAVIYHRGNAFSETLKNDFGNAFRIGLKGKSGQITQSLDIKDVSLNILESIEEIKQNSDAVLVISSIETNSVAIAITNKNTQQPPSQRLKLLFTTSLPETLILEKGGASLEGVALVSPRLTTESEYIQYAKDRWQQPDINWRVVTAYNATQAIIKAIKSSTEVTRETILENLKTIGLDEDESSGFGLSWSDTDARANDRREYSVWQVRDGRFEEI